MEFIESCQCLQRSIAGMEFAQIDRERVQLAMQALGGVEGSLLAMPCLAPILQPGTEAALVVYQGQTYFPMWKDYPEKSAAGMGRAMP